MPISSKQRASLRSEAHHLSALVHVGHNGITPAIQQSLDDALRTKSW
jgi:Predicted RNA-binding protein containing KH domain, possibly ribosomal protein